MITANKHDMLVLFTFNLLTFIIVDCPGILGTLKYVHIVLCNLDLSHDVGDDQEQA